jgi:hypothetical protein
MKEAIGAVLSLGLVGMSGLAGCATTHPVYGGYATTAPLAAPIVGAPGYATYGSAAVAPGAGTVIYGALAPEIRTLPDALARDVEGGIPIYR